MSLLTSTNGTNEHSNTDNNNNNNNNKVIGLSVVTNPSDNEEVKLPKPLSDLTAVVHEETGIVFISGGCDSFNGNTYDPDFDVYVCDSVSSKQYEFDIATLSITAEYDMPRMRYRHAAVIVNEQLFLVGGRDVEDKIVKEVDVSWGLCFCFCLFCFGFFLKQYTND
jgi:hypothetical protein